MRLTQFAAVLAEIGEGAQNPECMLPTFAISTAAVRHPERVTSETDNARTHNMTINKLWILPGMAVVIGIFMLGWMIGSGRAPEQQSQGLDRSETQPITTVGSQADIKRDGRTATTAEPFETPTALIARQKSRQLPAGGARNSLVAMERRLISSATDDLQAILRVTQDYRVLSAVSAGYRKKAASGVSTRPQATTGLTGNPQDTGEAALDSTASSDMGKPGKTASGETAFLAPSKDNAADEGSTPPRSSHTTTTSTAMVMQHQEAVTEQSPADTAGSKGPWVINLVSAPSKADADRMTKKALTRDILTEQQEVTVKGKPYWRVQMTGFATAEDARNHSEAAREKLGLKSVWIMKR